MFSRPKCRAARLALSMAFALALPGAAGPARADDGKGALKLAPPDATLVLSVDLEQLRQHPSYGQLVAVLDRNEGARKALGELRQEAGLDIHQDLRSLTLVQPAARGAGAPDALIYARGKLDAAKILAFADKRGAPATARQHLGKTWYEVDGGGVLFTDDYAVAGTTRDIQAAIAAAAKGRSLHGARAMAKLVAAVDTSADLWFTLLVPKALRAELGRDNPLYGKFTTAAGSVDVGPGLKARLALGATDAKAATAMAEVTRQGLAAAAADPQLRLLGFAAALGKVSVATRGAQVQIALELTEEEFAPLAQKLGLLLR